ncbi:MAG TPA: hypothetical protein VKA60_27660 [Blastocatellia bacterium]|nr:hypothetical protein [Blastocatellia bacterium]
MNDSQSKGIQAVTGAVVAIGATAGSLAASVEGKPRAVLAFIAAIGALVAAFSHPPRP